MLLYFKLLIVLLFCILKLSKCIEINAIAIMYNTDMQFYDGIIKDFNDYSEENGLDIKVNLNLYTLNNSTLLSDAFGTTLDIFFSKKLNKYDLIFYDIMYSTKYEPHLENLRDYIEDEYIDQYNPEVLSTFSTANNKLVGIPISMDFMVLYSNIQLLEKYGKPIPKTWDEMYETGMLIYNSEKENNPNLLGYNAIFPLSDTATCSLYETIYSYRETVESEFPGYESQEAIDAFKMMKKLLDDLSNPEAAQNEFDFVVGKMFDGNSVFLKYWYIDAFFPFYHITELPGRNRGVSGSVAVGTNIGINIYSADDKKKAAGEAIKYMMSKENVKKYVLTKHMYSAIKDIYDDEDICAILNCDFFKNVQLIKRPMLDIVDDYNQYSDQYRAFAYEFMYGDKSAEETLTKINEITRYFDFSLSTYDSPVGLILFIVIIIITLIIVASLLFLNIPNFQNFFSFLPKDLWYVVILGIVVLLCYNYLGFGPVTVVKCHLQLLSISLGLTLIFIPVLYKLICNFPEENVKSQWVFEHKYLFVGAFVFLDILLNAICIATPFDVEEMNYYNVNRNYKKCKMNGSGLVMEYLIIGLKIIFVFAMTFLIFIEWNLRETVYDVKFIISGIYVDVLSIILIVIIEYIKFDNYIVYNTIHQLIFLLFVVSNYFFLYGIRIIVALFAKEKDDMFNFSTSSAKLKNKYVSDQNTNVSEKTANTSIDNSSNDKRKSKVSKMMNYHYRYSISNNRSGTAINTINSNYCTSGVSQSQPQSQLQIEVKTESSDQ